MKSALRFITYSIYALIFLLILYFSLRKKFVFNLDLMPGIAPWFNMKLFPMFITYIIGSITVGIICIYVAYKKNIQLYFPSTKTCLSIFYYCLFIGAFIFTAIVYRNISLKEETIFNAYYRTPEYYKYQQNEFKKNFTTQKVTDEDKKYSYFNTIELLNSAHLFDGYSRIDALNPPDWKLFPSCVAVPPYSPDIQRLSDKYDISHALGVGDHVRGTSFSKNYPPILVYQEDRLCLIKAEGPDAEKAYLENLAVADDLATLGISVPSYFFSPENVEPGFSRERLLAKEFLKDAAFNNHFLIINRGNLTHHMHVVMPAHEYLLGKPLSEISHQYGLGLTLLTAGICKIFSPDGYADYGIFLKFIPKIVFLSFFIFSISMFIIFRKVEIAIIPILVWVLSRPMQGFEVYFDNASWTVTRTIFVPLLIVCIYLFFTKKTFQSCLWMLLCLPLCGFMNFQFGTMAAVSTLATFTIATAYEKKISYLLICIAIIIIICLNFIFFNIGVNHVSSAFIKGVLSVPLPSRELIAQLVIFVIFIGAFFYMKHKESSVAYPFLFSVFFRQTLMLYYIWSGVISHYHIYFIDTIMPYIFFGYFIIYENKKSGRLQNACSIIISVFICIMTGYYYSDYQHEEKSYIKNVKSMKIFEWNIPGAHIKTTMNPEIFNDSIDIIHDFTNKSQKSIYMISRFDSILSLLSRKYSALPHFNISPFIATKKEYQLIIDSFNKNKPQYIFVDNDINIPCEFDMVQTKFFGAYYHSESIIQLLQMRELYHIYKDVIENKYRPVAKSKLITVYEKIQD